MRARVVALDDTKAREFCIRLWFELTIVGRDIWSGEGLDAATQLNALKWLNEIQHRVWGAHASTRPGALTHLLDWIMADCEQAPVFSFHVRVALDRALDVVDSAADGEAGTR